MSQKQERTRRVLLGLVDLYLKMGKPIGSNTLRENGFEDLSSATIRNYFAELEKEGYLLQEHSSAGRVPSSLALKLFAYNNMSERSLDSGTREQLIMDLGRETREVAAYLHHAAETLSEQTDTAVFLSMPRFDQDFIVDVKLVELDAKRALCVLITQFGIVHTEILYLPSKLSSFSLKRIEAYFHFRMTGLDKPDLAEEEKTLAHHFYNEVLLRHAVNYANFSADDLYKTGFSKLLNYPELKDLSVLASSLSLFENTSTMRQLLRETRECGDLKFWIGEDLFPYTWQNHSSIIAMPYMLHQKPVGAIALLGPTRIPYKKLFALLRMFSDTLSEHLMKSLYKHKISFREPSPKSLEDKERSEIYLGAHSLLLEDQRGS